MKKFFMYQTKNTIRFSTLCIFLAILYVLIVPVLAETSEADSYSSFSINPWNTIIHPNEISISEIASSPYRTQALITWIASDLAEGTVYYATSTKIQLNSNTPSTHASIYANYANSKANLRFLLPDTEYYYKIVLTNSKGVSIVSEEKKFKTNK